MILYLDIFILENFTVNIFLLYITVQTLRKNIKMIYIALGSTIGTIYSVISVCSSLQYFYCVPLKLMVAFLMVIMVFRKIDFLFIIKSTIIFVLYTMLLAGICMFIEVSGYESRNIILSKFSYKILFSAIMLIYIFIHRIVNFVRDRKELSNLIYEVEIVTDKEVKKVRAFLDTGNELREPATNLPVMVVEKSIFNNLDINLENKFIIPYKVVSGFNGELQGFKPKYINIYKTDKIEQREVIVAFCGTELSNLNDYNALLSRGIV